MDRSFSAALLNSDFTKPIVMRTTWNFHAPHQLMFGAGAADTLGDACHRERWTNVVVITDRVLEKVGIVERVVRSLAIAGCNVRVFADSCAEPAIEVAIAAADFAQQQPLSAIVGLGGGSNMDLAKIVAVLATHGGHPKDYFSFGRVPGPVLPIICLPTTAGTGSEVSHAAVLTDAANKMKVSTLSQYLRPRLAIVDPVLTYSCPKQVSADSGIDALTHAIEGYMATDHRLLGESNSEPLAYEGSFPIADSFAEQAIRLVGQHLEPVVADLANVDARGGMALAATLAGLAFSNAGVALVHGLEYPLGGELHCTHGAGNGLLLPHVMRFNLPKRTEHLAKIAEWLGVDISGTTRETAAHRAIDRVVQMQQQIGIPQRIRDLGGKEEQLPIFAAKAFQVKRLLATNPRAATEADLLAILQAAF